MSEHTVIPETRPSTPPQPAAEGTEGRGPKLLAPFAIRDFRLLWTAMTVSLLGDGIYMVALAWEVYRLSNTPTALSVVSVAWSLPMVLCLLAGGVLSDRFDRRKVMITADVLRGVAIAGMGVLSVTGAIELWHIVVLAIVYGVGQALFGPAFGAIVPDIVPPGQLIQANSVDSFARPFGERLAGPAIGGFLIGGLAGGEAGPAFLIDAATFAFSAVILTMIRTRPRHDLGERGSAFADVAEGFRFVRAHTWLWGTLLSASLTLLFVIGPFQVLLPYLIKNKLGGGAGDIGLVYAAGGVGAICGAIFMGRRPLPRRHITFMYVGWGGGMLLLMPYAWITEVWQAMALEFGAWALFTTGLVVWMTLMHTRVPSELLGRVTSLDWLVSIGLIPVSFALTGPVSEAIGVEMVFIASGILGAAATFGFLLLPGIRDTEKGTSASA
ncbi:MAG TPA: MFS transporter [Actinomycetota bacterium]|nr:MFS transporter [Actinomycetota bacterium]